MRGFGLLPEPLKPFLSFPKGKHNVTKTGLALNPEAADVIWKRQKQNKQNQKTEKPSCLVVLSVKIASLVGNECGRLGALLARGCAGCRMVNWPEI